MNSFLRLTLKTKEISEWSWPGFEWISSSLCSRNMRILYKFLILRSRSIAGAIVFICVFLHLILKTKNSWTRCSWFPPRTCVKFLFPAIETRAFQPFYDPTISMYHSHFPYWCILRNFWLRESDSGLCFLYIVLRSQYCVYIDVTGIGHDASQLQHFEQALPRISEEPTH